MNPSDLTQLYPEVILAHYRSPAHTPMPADATHRAAGDNPLCGDQVMLGVQLRDGRLSTLGHETHGCALCVASASLMCKALQGTQVTRARALEARFRTFIAGTTARTEGLGELSAFSGVVDVPMRHTCALLPWDVLISALS